MFRKTNKEPQLNIFASVPSMLEGTSMQQYLHADHWHNQFRVQVLKRLDEAPYKVLFNEKMGAPNSPICTLVGMMILKEAFGMSDSQLFEQCRFNLLMRSALGLFNINDPVPVESTYYLLRKRIYEHRRECGEDLIEKTFEQITQGQIKEFNVNGRSIRMDSKLIGSNIAYYTRYEIIHKTLNRFYKTLDKQAKRGLSGKDKDRLEAVNQEEPGKTVYRSNKEEIKARMQSMGMLIYTLLNAFANDDSEPYQLLRRVFNEQYKVLGDQQVELRTKEEISSGSVQSPHDPDCAYRNKGQKPMKGYSVNITETCSDGKLNLITDVMIEKANTPDTAFVQEAIQSTKKVTCQQVDKVYLDGAYHSPDNVRLHKGIDFVFTGLQGAKTRYDLEMTKDGLKVTDTLTGECQQAVLVKKRNHSKENRWRIRTEKGRFYFTEQAVNASYLRRKIKQRSEEELHKRNNVEASIFQLSYPLRNNKTRYRGLFKQAAWAHCRCLWINLVRIMKFPKELCHEAMEALVKSAQLMALCGNTLSKIIIQKKLSVPATIMLFLSLTINHFIVR